MKKLMYVTTNAGDMIVSYDENEKVIRYLPESNKNPFPDRNSEGRHDLKSINDFLNTVEDDSSWCQYKDVVDVEDVEEFLEIDYNDPETPRIIAEIETDLL